MVTSRSGRSTWRRAAQRGDPTRGFRLSRLLLSALAAWLLLGSATSWGGIEGRRWPKNDPNAARLGACVTYSFMADGTVIGNPPDLSNTDPAMTSDFDAAVAGDANVGGVASARAAIRAALATWQAAADIHFLEVADNGVAFNGAGASGDIRFGGHDFAGGTLAHGYYPPANGVSAAGDIHFDGDYNWSTLAVTPAGNYDLQSVALHEIGHAIGLTHAPVGPDVMDPTIAAGTQERVLTAADIGFAQAIYGAPGHKADCTGIVGIVTGTPTLPPPGVLPHPRRRSRQVQRAGAGNPAEPPPAPAVRRHGAAHPKPERRGRALPVVAQGPGDDYQGVQQRSAGTVRNKHRPGGTRRDHRLRKEHDPGHRRLGHGDALDEP
jgi:hypothetical protein